MIPELGHFALIIALSVAIAQLIVPLIGAAKGNEAMMSMARPAAIVQFLFVAVSFGCLTAVFIGKDYSVLYAINHSNSLLPLLYRISGVWGGHEGSMLLWVLMLSGWGCAVAIFSRKLPLDMVARVLAVMGFISIGFYLFMLVTSNPFERVIPPALDGRDLNPLLQDPGLAIHPPMLYMGYVGFSVAFAFAIAALLSGRMDAAWARWSRPWTTVAWMFLTFGIGLGSWWAYYELGWGGWWFWDPVENASFMPWLVGTALIHSLAVTEKRGSFKNWTVLLAIFAFSLSLLGTFLVRSGVLTSVHSFATDPSRGTAILVFLCIVIGGSLTLYAWRAPKVGLGGKFGLISRESFLLANNVLLVVACGAVLLGTLYPLVLEAFDESMKISVGPPYFNMVFVPIMTPLLFLMGVGPISRWKQAEIPTMAKRLKWAFGVSVVSGSLVPVFMGEWKFYAALGAVLAIWIVASVVTNIVQRHQQRIKAGSNLGTFSRSYYGMQLAHIGIAIVVMGIAMIQNYQIEKDVRMTIGDTVELGDYNFRFDGTKPVKGPNYEADMGQFTVFKDDRKVAFMQPEKRFYNVQRQVMTEAAIDIGFTRDLYVSLGEPVGRNSWAVRVYYKPFVDWMWAGCFLMGLGGLLAVTDKRYRLASRKEKRAAPVAKPADDVGAEPSKVNA